MSGPLGVAGGEGQGGLIVAQVRKNYSQAFELRIPGAPPVEGQVAGVAAFRRFSFRRGENLVDDSILGTPEYLAYGRALELPLEVPVMLHSDPKMGISGGQGPAEAMVPADPEAIKARNAAILARQDPAVQMAAAQPTPVAEVGGAVQARGADGMTDAERAAAMDKDARQQAEAEAAAKSKKK